MNKNEFIEQLKQALSPLPAIEVREIIWDYEEHFREAFQAGRNEADVIRALGSPIAISSEILNKSQFEIVAETQPWRISPSLSFTTDEQSGYSWFKHAWRLFKQAPLIFISLGIISVTIDVFSKHQIADLNRLFYPIHNSIFTSIIVALSWNLDTTQNLDPMKALKTLKSTALNIILCSLLWALIMVIELNIITLIDGREMTLASYGNKTNLAAALFGIIGDILLTIFCIFTNALIVIEGKPVLTAYRLSFTAGKKYWKQIIYSTVLLTVSFGIIMLAGGFFIDYGFKISGLAGTYKSLNPEYFSTPILAPLAIIGGILSYTSWAAVFRDGEMKNH